MRWFTYPAFLLLHILGVLGMLRLLLGVAVVSSVIVLVLPKWQMEPLWVALAYLGLSSLWLLHFELKELERYCQSRSAQEEQRPLSTQDWRLLQSLNKEFQQWINRELRMQQLLQQRLDEISHSSNELQQSASLVTRNAEGQSESASVAAAAVEELNVSIVEVAHLAEDSRNTGVEASEKLSDGIRQLTNLVQQVSDMAQKAIKTNELIHELNSKSHTISEMSGVIRSIADQTNLLALNAAIEAARAGESGRGFAVVADEVRRLASHSQDSATEISRNIESVQQYISEATVQVSDLSEVAHSSAESSKAVRELLNQVQQQAQQLMEQVDQVAVSTEQQGRAVAEIAQLADNVRQGNADNLKAADQARAIAHHLAHLTGDSV